MIVEVTEADNVTSEQELYSTLNEFTKLRRKFHDTAKSAYPNVPYPEMVWLFDIGMKREILPEMVVAKPITRSEYKSFVLDENGDRELHPDGSTVQVTRKFTPAQKRVVKEFWLLLPEEMKAE